MITYYATTPHGYTFGWFVRDWAPDLADRVRVVGYSTLDLSAPPAPGLHVLTDFERLRPGELRFVRRLHARLSGRPGVRVIGNPSTWLPRHPFLKRLHEEGINDFRAYTLDELDDHGPHLRFPVFLRWTDEHGGSLGDRIRGPRALQERLAELAAEHGRHWSRLRRRLLVVEKVDASSPDGVFRKYSFARVGDAFIPRHVMTGKRWVTKNPKVVTPELVAEEEAFLADPPHGELMERAFEIAGIEFGRIDFGYADGRPQIWEINTNPMYLTGGAPHELRAGILRRQADLGREAILAQVPDPADPGTEPLFPAPERWAWAAQNRRSRRLDATRR